MDNIGSILQLPLMSLNLFYRLPCFCGVEFDSCPDLFSPVLIRRGLDSNKPIPVFGYGCHLAIEVF